MCSHGGACDTLWKVINLYKSSQTGISEIEEKRALMSYIVHNGCGIENGPLLWKLAGNMMYE